MNGKETQYQAKVLTKVLLYNDRISQVQIGTLTQYLMHFFHESISIDILGVSESTVINLCNKYAIVSINVFFL